MAFLPPSALPPRRRVAAVAEDTVTCNHKGTMKAVLCNQAVRGMLPCTPGRPTLAPRGGLLSSAPRLTSIVRHAQQTGKAGRIR